MRLTKLLIMSVIIGGLALVAGCRKDSNSGNGTLQVRMTDAPGAYDAVNIDVVGAEVHSDAQGWITLNNVHTGVYNLLDLTNGTDTIIATADIPSGTISQLRLILGSNNSVVIDGASHPMTVPSGSESGLKINIHDEVQTGETTTVLLDFNAGASVVAQGNGDYHLKPVIHAVVSTQATGSISGVIAPAVFANIYVVSGSDTLGTTAGLGGQFLIQAVPTGSYSLVVEPIFPYTQVVIPGVSVSAAQTTDVGLISL